MPSAQWVASRKQVKFYLTIAEYDALKRDCQQARLTMADYLRQLINRKD